MEHAKYYRSVLDSILNECKTAILEGLLFYSQIETYIATMKLDHVEFSIGSRYMPRGFYCPSPDIECIITNMRRGKIAKQLSKKAKPPHLYMFNEENKLFLVETFLPNGATETEYILHKQNYSYGFVYDRAGHVTSISIEHYADGKLCCYLWAACTYTQTAEYKFHMIIQEEFCYINEKNIETDFYTVQTALEQGYISRRKAAFELDENGKIVLNSRTLLLYDEAMLKL